MAALTDGEIEGWIADVTQIREHVRKVQRALLSAEECLLRLSVQLRDAAAPTLLDSLSDSPKE